MAQGVNNGQNVLSFKKKDKVDKNPIPPGGSLILDELDKKSERITYIDFSEFDPNDEFLVKWKI
jgi:hypothetical protein